PLFGIGFGTLHKYVAEYSQIISTTIEHNHNIYIQIATETGIVGFSIFLGLLVKVLNYFKNNLFKINNKNYIAVFCVFIMTMIHGLVDSVAFTPQILMILCIYAGTVSSRINN